MSQHQLYVTLRYYNRLTNVNGIAHLRVFSRYRCIARLRGAFAVASFKRRLLAVVPATIFTSVKHRWV